MSVLQELWFGNIHPNEEKIICKEERELVASMDNHENSLRSVLDEKDVDILNKYIDCCSKYTCLIESQAFELGFKFARQILCD